MDFKEKIDNILSFNQIGVNSVSALEDKVGAGRGAINEFYNDNREPGRKTLKKIMTFPGLSVEWYNTGKGPMFINNNTPVHKPSDNNEKQEMSADEVIRHLVDGDSDYVLINKELILERYRLYSIEQIQSIKDEAERKHKEVLQELEDRKAQIHGLFKIISELTSKLPPGEPAHMQKAQ